MFELYRQFQSILATCTASATAGSSDSLITAICYDSQGCCDETSAPRTSMSASPDYASCVMAAGKAEEKLACTG